MTGHGILDGHPAAGEAAMLPAARHLGISIVLRFPLGSIARAAWSPDALLTATLRLLARRIDRRAWKQAWSIHSPLVIVLSAMPGIGSFAYLTAKPVRSHRLLFRAAGDVASRKLPRRLYDRAHLARFIARLAGTVTVAEAASPPEPQVVPEPPVVVALASVEPAETPRRVIPFRSIPGRRGDEGSLPRTRTGPSVGDPAHLPAA